MVKKQKVMKLRSVDLETLSDARGGGDRLQEGRAAARGSSGSLWGTWYDHGNGYHVWEPGMLAYAAGWGASIQENPAASLSATDRGTQAETPASRASHDNARNHALGFATRHPGFW